MVLKILLSLFIFFFSVSGKADVPHFIPVEQSGVGKWQELPFGKARILSCTTGVKNLDMVVGGLQVRLDSGWILKKPTLRPLSEKMPSWIETPVRAGSGRNTFYEGEVFFPLVYARDPNETTPFPLGVEGDFSVCHEGRCLTLPLKMVIPLSAETIEYTSFCHYIIEQQLQTPLPADLWGIKGYAWEENDILRMAFSGIKDAEIAFLQTEKDDHFVVLETQLEKTGILLQLKKVQSWKIGTSKDWILLTDKGVFRVPVQMQGGPVSLPPAPVSFWIWLAGWEWFFFSPLFIWWGVGITQNKKVWKKKIQKFVLCLSGIFVCQVPLICLLGTWEVAQWLLYIEAIVLMGICIFPPQKWQNALLLFLFWPFFFLRSFPLGELSTDLLFIWTIVSLIEMVLPFIFLHQYADEIGKILREIKKKHFFVFNLIFLLPTVWLLAHLIFGLIQNSVPYQTDLNPDGITVVCGTDCKEWKKLPQVQFVSAKQSLGHILKGIYQRSQALVIYQDKGGRFILSPKTSLKKTLKFIENLKTYRALYKP